jgi:biopolymer transport protein ExbD
VDFDGVLTLDSQPMESIAMLERRLREMQQRVPAPHVLVSADARVPYEPVAQVLAATQRAHVANLRIVGLAKL